MAGYSEKPLIDKLGIKDDYKVRILNPPPGYFDLIQKQHVIITRSGKADFIHLFVKTLKELERRLPKLKTQIEKDGMIWISWPKKASKVLTDLDENKIREIALSSGLVDVKVCAIDETWSGLKLVYRLKDR